MGSFDCKIFVRIIRICLAGIVLLNCVACVNPLPSNVPQSAWSIKSGELASTTGTTFHSSMTIDPFGNIYLAGHLEESSVAHGYHLFQLSKFFTDGNLSWSVTALDTVTVPETQVGIAAIQADNVGDVYSVGSLFTAPPTSTLPAAIDWVVEKRDTQGVLLWQNNVSATNSSLLNVPVGLVLADNAQVFAYGRQVNINQLGDDQIVLVAYDKDGKALWQKNFLTAEALHGFTLANYRNGAVYFSYPERANDGVLQWVFMKLDMVGNILWETRILETEVSLGLSALKTDQAGNLYLIARSDLLQPTGYIRKISATGTSLWKMAFTEPFSATVNARGESFVLLGTTQTRLLKINQDGNIGFQKSISFGAQASITSRDAFSMSMLVDDAERVYAAVNLTSSDQSSAWGVVKILTSAGAELASIQSDFKISSALTRVDRLGFLYVGNATYLSKYSVTEIVSK